MSKIYYHAGLSRISKFYVPFGGLHMGGLGSALEAALRKRRKQSEGFIYLHSVVVEDSLTVEQDDLGDAHSWDLSWGRYSKTGIAGWNYVNLFEPDPKRSLCLFDLSVVREIRRVDVLTLDQAEENLIKYEEIFNFEY